MPDGPVQLVAGHHVEIGIKVLHVHGHVHGGLRAVDQHRNAALMGDLDDFLHRHHRSKRVGHVGDGDHLRARRQRLDEVLDVQRAVIVHRHPTDVRAAMLAVEVPRHDVGVVFENGDDDVIALAHHHAAETLRHEVDGVSGVAGEDDLLV
jgi:hypothetical protein